jgi:hypothetical protein
MNIYLEIQDVKKKLQAANPFPAEVLLFQSGIGLVGETEREGAGRNRYRQFIPSPKVATYPCHREALSMDY